MVHTSKRIKKVVTLINSNCPDNVINVEIPYTAEDANAYLSFDLSVLTFLSIAGVTNTDDATKGVFFKNFVLFK